LRACLLMFSASPATAAMEICCVWWTTKEEALADAEAREQGSRPQITCEC